MKVDMLLARLCVIYGALPPEKLAQYAKITKWHAGVSDWAIDRILAYTRFRGVRRLHDENHDPKNPRHYAMIWPTVEEVAKALATPREATAEERRFVDLCAAGKVEMGGAHSALLESARNIQKRRAH